MFEKFITIFLLVLISINSRAETVSHEEPFYSWLAQSQVMKSNSLVIKPELIQSNYATVERIANSTPMLKFYADELYKQGVPLDFIVLPLIESGNNPQARSPKNALGLWQFMPITGREWGLGATNNLDERIDVQKSTAAAAAYLKSLYNQFGDWNLVVASYNWGSASVSKALKKGLKTNDGRINLSLLPEETRNYLISFYAFNRVIYDNHKKPPLIQYPNKPFLVKIQSNNLNSYVRSIPSLSNVNEVVLRHMNGFDLKVADNSPRIMLVPTDTFAQYFMTNKISFKFFQAPLKKANCDDSGGSTYSVVHGDTFELISKKFRMSVDALKNLNPSVRFLRPGVILDIC